VAHHRSQIACFGDHLHVFLPVEQLAQAAAHELVVIRKDDADRSVGRWTRVCGARSRRELYGRGHDCRLTLRRRAHQSGKVAHLCGKPVLKAMAHDEPIAGPGKLSRPTTVRRPLASFAAV
jgi:hypothetical protein